MPRTVKLTDSVYARLKALSERTGVSMAQLVGNLVNKSRKVVKNMGEEENPTVICDECDEEGVPKDASFCPYCGVEFEEDEETEESEEED